MKRAAIKSTDLVQRAPKRDLLVQGLDELLHAVTYLCQRVMGQIASVTHSETPDEIALVRECGLCLKEYQYLADVAVKIAGPVEYKIHSFLTKKGFVKQDPFPASSWSPILLLNLLREQAMGKRQQEIQEFEKRKREQILQLDAKLNACKERFTELVPHLNLLCYMRECLKNEHALPANVMYHTNIPQTVRSPFMLTKPSQHVVPKHQMRQPIGEQSTSRAEPPVRREKQESQNKQFLDEKIREEEGVQGKHVNREDERRKRQELLRKMRDMQQENTTSRQAVGEQPFEKGPTV